ncbi:Phox homologous domain [Macleaya cordata]|uniref:Phox homologous domain n=1 Tax=Macleaya cordata TaxID=56857 RepID=A0A200QY77_MACCD|nr:Phox homologous domain [Macleaya cordata]
MKKAMETVQDLIEEAKVRTVCWALCIFAISYFLSHTSKSMWTNIPIAILLLSAFRLLSYEVEFRWKVPQVRQQTYLSHLEKKKLSVDDPRLSTSPPALKWKRKIDSPLVEAAVDEFINKILQDFVVDLWYSAITPDKDAPKLMYSVITDVLGEISTRVKAINLVDLLTRDMVDLIGNHFDLYRRNQSIIGVEVMGTLSFEERDERLKHHLIASKELHPALISPECEYKVLQRLMGGLLAVVLRRQESQCPLVRCISRELLTCLVMQPIMNLASPGFINELIEYILLSLKDDKNNEVGNSETADSSSHCQDHPVSFGSRNNEPSSKKSTATSNQNSDVALAKTGSRGEPPMSNSGHSHSHKLDEDFLQQRSADWARVLEAATQRRTEVLAPENLENLWTKGRNYKRKIGSHDTAGGPLPAPPKKNPGIDSTASRSLGKESYTNRPGSSTGAEDKIMVRSVPSLSSNTQTSDMVSIDAASCQNLNKVTFFDGGDKADMLEEYATRPAMDNKTQLKRSSSTSALKIVPDNDTFTSEGGVAIISEKFYSSSFGERRKEQGVMSASDTLIRSDGHLHAPKLKCRVVGAYFEKTGSKSFAVYSIAVTDAENKTWFVKRRYRNFERLHRHLKDIPNYTLHIPPKRFLSSSVDDSFVHQRCIQLDQYLQDLLSIANVAEQHEVWDFLSVSSKNYSFGKSTSVMKTLAVNVDDAMDDILRQVKGVSDGLMRKVVGPSSSLHAASSSVSGSNLSWNGDEMDKHGSNYNKLETSQSLSDNEEGDMGGSHGHEEIVSGAQVNGWHSDNELNSKGFPPRVIKRDEEASGYPAATSLITSGLVDDPIGVPPEWTPPNVSVPLLNLVDKIFQLNRRGWLSRRQVFWISKQILQLMMEDAIDDWLLRQIQWLRRDDIIARGIRWVQDVLWPDGTFFIKFGSRGNMDDITLDQKLAQATSSLAGNKISKPGSFEMQLEAARRASDIKKMMLGGAPTALVSLIGHKQYTRCAKDLYYFLQSNICVKQLAYGMLELILVSVFPELQDLVLDVHEKSRFQPA